MDPMKWPDHVDARIAELEARIEALEAGEAEDG